MYTVCLWRYVCIQEVLSVRTRKGTDIRKFAQHRFRYKTIYHTIYVVSVRKGTSICEFAQLGLLYSIQEYIKKILYMYTYEHAYAYKEILNVSLYRGRSICGTVYFLHRHDRERERDIYIYIYWVLRVVILRWFPEVLTPWVWPAYFLLKQSKKGSKWLSVSIHAFNSTLVMWKKTIQPVDAIRVRKNKCVFGWNVVHAQTTDRFLFFCFFFL